MRDRIERKKMSEKEEWKSDLIQFYGILHADKKNQQLEFFRLFFLSFCSSDDEDWILFALASVFSQYLYIFTFCVAETCMLGNRIILRALGEYISIYLTLKTDGFPFERCKQSTKNHHQRCLGQFDVILCPPSFEKPILIHKQFSMVKAIN